MNKKITRIMKCKKCGGNSFSFRWKYYEKDRLRLIFCHDGVGYQLTDAIVRCDKCGIESEYEEEDFITTKEVE